MRKGLSALVLLLLSAAPVYADGIVNPQTNASALTTGTVAAARGGAGTINGALKGNGSGTVSQAACADLSDAAAGCSANSLPVTSKTVTCSRDLSLASGAQTIPNATDCGGITTFGFQPSACTGFGSKGSGTSFSTLNAVSDSSLAQSDVSNNGTVFTIFNGIFFAATDGTNAQQAVISAYNATTLTLTWTKTASPTGTFSFSIRCLK